MRVRSISHIETPWLVVLVAWGGVLVALASQHLGGFEPCPWCVIQRIAYLAVGLFALIAALVRRPRPLHGLLLGLSALSALGGLAAALHQHFVAAQTSSCAFTAADRWISWSGLADWLPSVFSATAACDEANSPMLGLPYSVWSMLLAVLLLILLLRVSWRSFRRPLRGQTDQPGRAGLAG